VIKVFRVDRDAVRARLRDWAQSLRSRPEVLRVVLFGSFARGDATARSDADVVVILRDSPLQFHERIPYYRPRRVGVCVDVFPYTLDEARRSLREGWGVVPIALAEGETLYAAPGAPPLEP
jgi:hypothetical protein